MARLISIRKPRLGSILGARRYRILLPTDRNSCNPTIAVDGDGFRLIVRTVNYRFGRGARSFDIPVESFETENWLVRLDREFNVLEKTKINDGKIRADKRAARGLEDARIFFWRGAWWFIASALAEGPARTTMVLCRLEGAEVAEARFIASPFDVAVEKNWMPRVDGETLKLVYRVSPTLIVDCDTGELSDVLPVNARFPGWSGSSQCVRYGDGWLSVIHRRVVNEKSVAYEHAFVELDGAFRILRASGSWYFDEPTVEFCAGLCLADGAAILAYGHMDCEARMISVPLPAVERLLRNDPIFGFAVRALSFYGARFRPAALRL